MNDPIMLGREAKRLYPGKYDKYTDEAVGRAIQNKEALAIIESRKIVQDHENRLTKAASDLRISKENYDKLTSVKIDLEAQLGVFRVQSEEEKDRLRLAHKYALEKAEAESRAEIQRIETTSKTRIKELETENRLLRERLEFESKTRQDEKDRELEREIREAEWNKQEQLEYVRRTDTFQLNYQLEDLRKRHSNLLDEIDELLEKKTDKSSWQEKYDMAVREKEIVKEQISGIETQLRQSSNGKG